MANEKLKAPLGVSEISVGTKLYTVDVDGSIEADELDVPALEAAGFLDTAPPVPVPDGLVAMNCEPGSSCSFGGVSYTDNNGVINVPAGAVSVLLDHGFTLPAQA